MISHKYKCIFIHIPRTGGSSIESAVAGKNWWQIEPETKHITTENAVKIYGKYRWSSYFTFTFVRNPWDRMVSLWTCKHYSNQKKMGFKWFVNHFQPIPHEQPFLNQIDIIGMQQIDFIGRFERLQIDFNTICEQVGMPQKILPVAVASTNRKHYTHYYDDETKQIVANRCEKDIHFFGYEFGK
jgi:hypothetical protein